jgi:hypothetical protein
MEADKLKSLKDGYTGTPFVDLVPSANKFEPHNHTLFSRENEYSPKAGLVNKKNNFYM